MRVPSERALQEQNLPTGEGFSYLLMDSPFFVMLDKDAWLPRRRQTRAVPVRRGQSPLQVTLFVNGGRDFDVHASSAYPVPANRADFRAVRVSTPPGYGFWPRS